MPGGADVVCTARLERVEGRKIWTVAEVADRPSGTVYASGRALYVTPKQPAAAEAAAADGQAADGQAADGQAPPP